MKEVRMKEHRKYYKVCFIFIPLRLIFITTNNFCTLLKLVGVENEHEAISIVNKIAICMKRGELGFGGSLFTKT